jgi:hypothetical protein
MQLPDLHISPTWTLDGPLNQCTGVVRDSSELDAVRLAATWHLATMIMTRSAVRIRRDELWTDCGHLEPSLQNEGLNPPLVLPDAV